MNVITPGWIVALPAGAQAEALAPTEKNASARTLSASGNFDGVMFGLPVCRWQPTALAAFRGSGKRVGRYTRRTVIENSSGGRGWTTPLSGTQD